MDASRLSCRFGILFFLATIAGVYGQVAVTSQSTQPASSSSATQQNSQNLATLRAYQQEQSVLFQEWQALVASGATPEQLQAWSQQNSTQLALQQQLIQSVAVATALQPRPMTGQPSIPTGASSTLQALLTTRAALANSRAQIHNELMQQASATGSSLTYAQLQQMEQQEEQLFQQQNAALLTLRAQQSQTLAQESAQTLQPVPPLVVIPQNTSPQLAAYMTTRNQIRRAMTQMRNQYATATPEVREAAMEAWQQQNTALFALLQQEGQNLAQANPTPPN